MAHHGYLFWQKYPTTLVKIITHQNIITLQGIPLHHRPSAGKTPTTHTGINFYFTMEGKNTALI
jgi:hypothetical protein